MIPGYAVEIWPGGGYLARSPGLSDKKLIGWYPSKNKAVAACTHHRAESKSKQGSEA